MRRSGTFFDVIYAWLRGHVFLRRARAGGGGSLGNRRLYSRAATGAERLLNKMCRPEDKAELSPRHAMNRARIIAMGAGIAGALLSGLGALFDRAQFFESYLFGFLYWTGIALGCFGLRHAASTGGRPLGPGNAAIFRGGARDSAAHGGAFYPDPPGAADALWLGASGGRGAGPRAAAPAGLSQYSVFRGAHGGIFHSVDLAGAGVEPRLAPSRTQRPIRSRPAACAGSAGPGWSSMC